MLPIGDFQRRDTTPYVNWTLIAINVLVFLYTLTLSTTPDHILAGARASPLDQFFFDWGFVPSCIGKYFGANPHVSTRIMNAVCPSGDRVLLQPFTAMFVHAGWLHIGGNMLFLWIFGDNVEDSMGHARYLLFYFICGLAAAAAQTYFALNTVEPAVGASGAIAGVLGAYLVMFPLALVQVIILPLFFIPFFVPAVVLIGIWFLTQLFTGIASVGGNTAVDTSVAWWAHVGGFVAGAVLIWFFRRKRKRPARTLYWGSGSET